MGAFQYLLESYDDSEQQNVSVGIEKIYIAIKMLWDDSKVEEVVEKTDLEPEFVANINRVIIAIQMLQEGADITNLSKKTGFEISELEKIKLDIDRQVNY